MEASAGVREWVSESERAKNIRIVVRLVFALELLFLILNTISKYIHYSPLVVKQSPILRDDDYFHHKTRLLT